MGIKLLILIVFVKPPRRGVERAKPGFAQRLQGEHKVRPYGKNVFGC
jgi:hypothetical protein